MPIAETINQEEIRYFEHCKYGDYVRGQQFCFKYFFFYSYFFVVFHIFFPSTGQILLPPTFLHPSSSLFPSVLYFLIFFSFSFPSSPSPRLFTPLPAMYKPLSHLLNFSHPHGWPPHSASIKTYNESVLNYKLYTKG